jgi:hypothetical protein
VRETKSERTIKNHKKKNNGRKIATQITVLQRFQASKISHLHFSPPLFLRRKKAPVSVTQQNKHFCCPTVSSTTFVQRTWRQVSSQT